MIQTTPDAVRMLAADDVAVGEFVVVMSATAQIPSYFWCFESLDYPRNEMVQMNFVPSESGQPLEVVAICLPFLLVEDFASQRQILDLRHARIARVNEAFAEKTRKSLAKNNKR